MTKEELAEIREWIESEEVWEILTPDWRELTLDLLAEVERLQVELQVMSHALDTCAGVLDTMAEVE